MSSSYIAESGVILALDPSLNGTGFAVVNFNDRIDQAIAYGTFHQEETDFTDDEKWRRAMVFMRNKIRQYKPEVLVYEDYTTTIYGKQGATNFNQNAAQLKMLGALVSKCDEIRLTAVGFRPTDWKRYCQIPTGKGTSRFQKGVSVQKAKEYFGLVVLDHNAADALNMARYYAEKFALAQLRNLRVL